MSATKFDDDTAAEPLGGGAYSVSISGDWSAPPGPNGGYVAALVLRAMEAEVGDPERAPRSLTLHYLRPPVPGVPATVEVEIVRAGRSLSTLSARLLQDGEPKVVALAAFALDFTSNAGAYESAAPSVPPAEEVAIQVPHPRAPKIAHRLEFRHLFGPAPFTGSSEALTGGWTRLAEPRATDAAVAALFLDAWLPAPWPRLTGLSPAPTIDLTIHFRQKLPLAGLDPEAPLLARFHSRTARDGFFEEDGELWAPDGRLLAQSRQLGILKEIIT